MILSTLLIILALAFLVGVIGNISGIGGGVMIILFLVYVFNFNPLDAAGLSLLTIVFSSLTGTIQNMRMKLVDYRLFWMIGVVAVIGAVAGSILASYISAGIFKGVFAVVIILLGLFSVSASHRQTKGRVEQYDTKIVHSPDTSMVSIIAGVISGFIGIGIGGIVGTYLTAIKRSQPKIAIATIIAATVPVSLAGMAMHFYYTGFINIVYAPPLVVGAFFGGMVGSLVIRKAPQVSLRFFQGYIIIAFGLLSAFLYVLSTY